ncbi:MAG: hypothetical protein KDD22_08340 [Bdellovibrionales bacterium]|nr:hypothetical protein [Bdellovibrionales bacterium]
MQLIKFYYREFMKGDIVLKVILLLFTLMWVYNVLFPERPMTTSSYTEAVIAYGFFFGVIIASVGLFLALEQRGGEIDWKGCDTVESRALVTKLLVRGGLIVCLIIGLI